MAFGRRHPLNLLHATPGGPSAVREEPDAGRQDRVEFPNEPSQDPHRIPQQGVVGGVVDVGLDHRRVDAQLFPILETTFNGRVDDRLIDGLQGRGSEPVDGAVERVVFGHPLAVELGEMAQRVSIRNAFAQFAIIPVLHTGQDQRPEDLLRGQAAPAGLPVLQAALEVAANAVDDVALLVEEVRDRFERRFQLDTLLDELQIRETDLGSLLSHGWSPCA